MAKQQITQHKRFVPYSTHPNPALLKVDNEILWESVRTSQEPFRMVAEIIKKCWASFILGTLGDIAVDEIWRHRKCC